MTNAIPSGYRVRQPFEEPREGDELYPVWCGAARLPRPTGAHPRAVRRGSSIIDLGDFGIGIGLYMNSLVLLGVIMALCSLVSLPVIIDNTNKQADLNGGCTMTHSSTACAR